MLLRKIAVIVLTACLGISAHAQPGASLRLVPFPKVIKLHEDNPSLLPPADPPRRQLNDFRLTPGLFIVANEIFLPAVKELLAPELRMAGVDMAPNSIRGDANFGFDVVVRSPLSSNSGFADNARLSSKLRPGEYAMHIGPMEAEIRGADRAGTLSGIATLAQLIRANRLLGSLPCLDINDWPTLPYRAFQDDLTRGPSSTLEELKHEVRLGASLKLNVFTYYMEHQYAFKKHPMIGPKDGSLTPEDLKALVEYAGPRGVEILGNQQSFGHFAEILKHPEFAPLRENSYILSPVNEGSYKLLDDLYSEVIPILPFPFFNVCCDETADLGKGASKELADRIGVGEVYARHIRRIHDIVTDKYKKRMMMWGDIILNHPDKLSLIPKDTVMMTWGYEPAANYDSQILPFVKNGYEFWVCPGVSGWNVILPNFNKANANIQVFTRDGVKHGAAGMLNTAWDDDASTLNAPNWYGFAWGAECAWNGGTTSVEDFNRRIGTVLFGESGEHFGHAIELLSKTHSLPGMEGMSTRRFWQLDLDCDSPTFSERVRQAEALVAITKMAIAELEACQKDAKVSADLLDAYLFGARRMDLIGRRILDQSKAAKAYLLATTAQPGEKGEFLDTATSLIQGLKASHEELAKEFTKLWLKENRPYALDRTMKRYTGVVAIYDGILAHLKAAKKLSEGSPMPSLNEIGLGIPATSSKAP